ncbi:hypothetical protein N5B55_13380 [Ralstonia pickettii]|nr:hypothetical protein [Ralstonia sp. 5_2_56FAA]WKZ87032.1 hypothetical protein N5B55_13380 [Ralstonia pickettii]
MRFGQEVQAVPRQTRLTLLRSVFC